ncbi:MAG TPA: NAD(P)-dependent oxidoreductase [Dehalococcoidia bacterium]|nr:NAD(P)-dependent oxidoreductase [Dehalococcoidia bacterium]
MILITGGLGMIGLHTARHLLDMGEDVVLTQYRVPRIPDFLKDDFGKRVHIEQLDITDGEALLEIGRRHKITGLLHLAAPGLGELAAADDYRMNTQGLLNVLVAAEAWDIKRTGLASSIAVYAGVKQGPFREDQPLRTYGGNHVEAYKKTFEILGSHYAQRVGLGVVSLRIGGIYGPMDHNLFNIATRFLHMALGREVPNWPGELFAEDANDLCYVRDCARGIALLQTAEKLDHATYNVASGVASSVGEVAALIEARFPDAKLPVTPGYGPNHRHDALMDITRIREDTGYQPRFALDQSIEDFVDWLQTHPQ